MVTPRNFFLPSDSNHPPKSFNLPKDQKCSGTRSSHAYNPSKYKTFLFSGVKVGNDEYGAVAKGLGKDRYVLLEHDFEKGETKIVRKGATAEAAAAGPVYTPGGTNFDQGDV